MARPESAPKFKLTHYRKSDQSGIRQLGRGRDTVSLISILSSRLLVLKVLFSESAHWPTMIL